MPDYITDILNHKPLVTLAIGLSLLGLRFAVVRLIKRKSEVLSDQQRRWIYHTKNITLALILFAIIFIWWPELRQFALSIAAVAVAFVIASKELILCISGTVLRTTTGDTSIGDWVEIGEMRGEIIDQNILSTVLQEVSRNYDYTGKTITLPNSLFLAQPIRNLNFMRRFVFHSFDIVTDADINTFEAKALILENIAHYSAEFADLGTRYHSFIVQRSGMNIPPPNSSVRISTSNLGKNIFNVTLFCPTQQAVSLEQKITEDFLRFFYDKKRDLKQVPIEDKSNES